MVKVYEFLANGFEEIEALAPVDILRRGGIDIKTVSITGSQYAESSHGITIKADLRRGRQFWRCRSSDAAGRYAGGCQS